MKLQVFSVFDKKSGAYSNPYYMPTKGLMLRAFGDECVRDDSAIKKHPEDYELYILAEWDTNSGKFENLLNPEFMCSALDFTIGKAVDHGTESSATV